MPPRTALDAAPNVLDGEERRFVASVREHGWYRTEVIGVGGSPGFSFTAGFWVSAASPELIMFGLKGEVVHEVFWDPFRDAEAGRRLPVAGRTEEVFENCATYAYHVARRHYPGHLGWNRWFYGGDDFPCLRLVWPEPVGVFPWEDGFDPAFAALRPDLTEGGWKAALAG